MGVSEGVKIVELIQVTEDNLDKEHICCAIANNKDIQVQAKKEWLRARFAEGLVFLKGDVRGKCFIEYIPAEKAWAPIEAQGYMYIDCLWVSGQFKGKGYSNLLLEACIRDSQAKGKKGLVILSAKKKLPFMSDPKYLAYKGFSVCDTAGKAYTLMVLTFGKQETLPRLRRRFSSRRLRRRALSYTTRISVRSPRNMCLFSRRWRGKRARRFRPYALRAPKRRKTAR